MYNTRYPSDCFHTMPQSIFIPIVTFLVLLTISIIIILSYFHSLKQEIELRWVNLMEKLHIRLDKIPNLIETVRSSAKSPEEFQNLIQLRSKSWAFNNASAEKVQIELEITEKLRSIWENFTSALHVNTNFLALKTEFHTIDKEILRLAENYNNKVKHYNQARKFFLFNLLTAFFGYKNICIFDYSTALTMK